MGSHTHPANLHYAPYEIDDPGSGAKIVVDRWGMHVPLDIDAAAEANTLVDPVRAGQRVCIFAAEVAGGASRVVTAQSAINASGSTYMTFDAVDELAILESFPVASGSYEWRVVVESGVTVA